VTTTPIRTVISGRNQPEYAQVPVCKEVPPVRNATRFDNDQWNLDLNWRNLMSNIAINAAQIWM